MSPKYERRTLETLLKAIDGGSPSPSILRTWLLTVSIWLGVAIVLLVVFRSFGPLDTRLIVLLSVGFGIGLLASYDFYKSIYAQQWPVMSRYMDRAQIEQRLRELGA